MRSRGYSRRSATIRMSIREQGIESPLPLEIAKKAQDYEAGGGRNQMLSQIASDTGPAVSLGWTKAISCDGEKRLAAWRMAAVSSGTSGLEGSSMPRCNSVPATVAR